MRRGDVLFFHPQTKHASLANVSDQIRWSFDLRYVPTGQPHGRPMFPGFVARSRRDPATELRDPVAWADMWHRTRAHLSDREKPSFNRWTGDFPGCA
jgi:ectoine hydroxylase-related dioxygenase (phytanoyl-CoA dioxygenase family)